jgi:hypothetical protein
MRTDLTIKFEPSFRDLDLVNANFSGDEYKPVTLKQLGLKESNFGGHGGGGGGRSGGGARMGGGFRGGHGYGGRGRLSPNGLRWLNGGYGYGYLFGYPYDFYYPYIYSLNYGIPFDEAAWLRKYRISNSVWGGLRNRLISGGYIIA